MIGLKIQLLPCQVHLTSTAECGLKDGYIIFMVYGTRLYGEYQTTGHLFQTPNNQQQQIIVEETVLEDATVPEQVAQEIIIDGRTITHISAGPFDGYLQGPLHVPF